MLASTLAWLAISLCSANGNEAFVSSHLQNLGHPNPEFRARSLSALGQIEPLPPRAIPRITEATSDRCWFVRRAAVGALQQCGPIAASAIPAIVKRLHDADYTVRADAAGALGSFWPVSNQPVPGLIRALRDSQWEVRCSAAYSLGEYGSRAPEAEKEIARCLSDSSPDVRAVAARVLSHFVLTPKSIGRLVCAASDPNAEVRRRALGSMDRVVAAESLVWEHLLRSRFEDARLAAYAKLRETPSPTPEVLRLVTRDLRDARASVRISAADLLGHWGPVSRSAIPALKLLLNDRDFDVRRTAITGLGKIGVISPSLVRALIAEFRQPTSEYAQVALVKLGPAVIPALVAALGDPNKSTRLLAAQTLGLFGSPGEVAVAALVRRLQDRDPEVRGFAATSLGQIGSPAHRTVDHLFSLLATDNVHVGEQAYPALIALGKHAVSRAERAVHSAEEAERCLGLAVLGDLGSIARSSVEAIRLVAEKHGMDHSIAHAWIRIDPAAVGPRRFLIHAFEQNAGRRDALRSLRRSTSAPSQLVPLFELGLRDPDADVRLEAVHGFAALHRAGTPAHELIGFLLDALTDSNAGVRQQAVRTVAQFGPTARDAVPILLAYVMDRRSDLPAVHALAEIQLDADFVIAALVHSLRHDHLSNEEAFRALARIGPPAIPAMVIELAQASDLRLNLPIAQAFVRMGRPAIPALVALLVHHDVNLRRDCVALLGKIQAPETTNPVLIELLRDKSAIVRLAAASALRAHGGNAKAAVPALINATHDCDSGVRREAVQAVNEIDPKAARRAKLPIRVLQMEWEW